MKAIMWEILQLFPFHFSLHKKKRKKGRKKNLHPYHFFILCLCSCKKRYPLPVTLSHLCFLYGFATLGIPSLFYLLKTLSLYFILLIILWICSSFFGNKNKNKKIIFFNSASFMIVTILSLYFSSQMNLYTLYLYLLPSPLVFKVFNLWSSGFFPHCLIEIALAKFTNDFFIAKL